MQIIDELRDRIAKKRLSVLKVANETGISAYKMYKWLDGKAQPKHDDVVILEKWLRNKMEKVLSEETGKIKDPPKPNQIAVVLAKEDLDALTDIVIKNAATLSDVHYMLRILTGQEPGPEESQEVSYKKQEKKTDKKGMHDGAGKKRN